MICVWYVVFSMTLTGKTIWWCTKVTNYGIMQLWRLPVLRSCCQAAARQIRNPQKDVLTLNLGSIHVTTRLNLQPFPSAKSCHVIRVTYTIGSWRLANSVLDIRDGPLYICVGLVKTMFLPQVLKVNEIASTPKYSHR